MTPRCYLTLLVLALCSTAPARVGVLFVENGTHWRVGTLAPETTVLLDSVSLPRAEWRTDPNPCDPKARGVSAPVEVSDAPPRALVARQWSGRSPSPPPWGEIFSALQVDTRERITLFAVGWGDRMEPTGVSLHSFPSEGVLPPWVGDVYGRFFGSTVEQLWGALGDGFIRVYSGMPEAHLDRSTWEGLGVEFPRKALAHAQPFLTRHEVRTAGVAGLRWESRHRSEGFQPSWTLRRPWNGKARCPAARNYPQWNQTQLRKETELVSRLTGWPLSDGLSRSGLPQKAAPAVP